MFLSTLGVYAKATNDKQEIKDEFKELEGQPEVRQKIKQKQREMAEQRMLKMCRVRRRIPTQSILQSRFDMTGIAKRHLKCSPKEKDT